MADLRAQAEVRIWGRTVGAVLELASGRILFEYDEAFAGLGIELSPIHLPASRRGPIAFDELRRSPAFDGLPGLLADALPDAFGNRVIRAWYAARGQTERAMSPVQRLLYVGDRALGALTFHPAEELPRTPAESEALAIEALVQDARRIIEGRPDVAIPEIYRIGSSAGGMRPKAVVLHDERSGRLRSGHAAPGPDDRPCILKFDGAGTGTGGAGGRLGDPLPYNRVEAAYSHMARAAGIETSDITILEQDGYAHLLIRRFDREDGRRIHQHTLGGLLHVDYNLPGASSYEEYFRTVLRLGLAGGAIEEAYRRAVFNVLAVNQDDHVKNLSFHLREGGGWSLSPAYDLTFARGSGFTARHQMRLADKVEGITDRDLLELGRSFGLRRRRSILESARAAIRRWPEFAAAAQVPAPTMEAVGRALLERAKETGG